MVRTSKKISKKLIATFLMISMLFCMSGVMANDVDSIESYEYHVRPGSTEWALLQNQDDMINACQVSESILKNMTTSCLIETILNYPLLMNIYAFETLQIGLDSITSSFNGLQELKNRSDSVDRLLYKYDEMQVDSSFSSNSVTDQIFKLLFIEALLSSSDYINKMNDIQLIRFQTEASEKFNLKSNYLETYGSLVSPYYTSLSEQSEVAIYNSTTVYTPKGVAVTVTINNELSDQGIMELNRYFDGMYPLASRIGGTTRKYNCHSYAWYLQSITNPYWMNDPSPYYSGKNASYTEQFFQARGFRVTYDGSVHSAVISQTSSELTTATVKSKWGQAGLYSHNVNYGPYWSSTVSLSIYG